jgi:sporulation protein YlmC with PRC-barrel domain
MTTGQIGTLVPLSDYDGELVDPDSDITGREVVDAAGEDVGKVDELLVDADRNVVRFMEIAHGGFLGIGQSKVLVPIDAVSSVGDDQIRISKMKADIEGAPPYDDAATGDPQAYWGSLYGYYGYAPYWGPGDAVATPGVGGPRAV